MCWLYVLVLSVGVVLIVNLAAWCTMPCRVLSQVEVLAQEICVPVYNALDASFCSFRLPICPSSVRYPCCSIDIEVRYCGGIHQAHKDRTSEQRDQGLTLIRVGAVVVEVPVPL